MTKVSVIIPVFNVEKYLRKCLESVAGQSLKNIEIICVDDGSTDGSPDILREFAQKDNRLVVISQTNQGQGVARNKGIENAKGEYIAFVDSDDWIDKVYLEDLYKKAVGENADIVRTCYKNYYNFFYEKQDKFNKILKEKSKCAQNLSPNEHSVVIWNALYNTQFLRDNNIYFEILSSSEDIPFTTKCMFLARRIIPLYGKSFYHYRKRRKNGLSSVNREKFLVAGNANFKAIEFLNSIETDKNDYIKAYEKCMWRFGNIVRRYNKYIDENLKKELYQMIKLSLENFKYQNEIQCLKLSLKIDLSEAIL